MSDESGFGQIARKVQEDLDSMVTSHPMGEALSEVALRLAKKLDGEVEDKSVAGIARELRATMVELAKYALEGEDELGAELSQPSE